PPAAGTQLRSRHGAPGPRRQPAAAVPAPAGLVVAGLAAAGPAAGGGTVAPRPALRPVAAHSGAGSALAAGACTRQRRAAVPRRPPGVAARGHARGLPRPPAPARSGHLCPARCRARRGAVRTPADAAGPRARGHAAAAGPPRIPRARAHPGPDEEPVMTQSPAVPPMPPIPPMQPVTGEALASRVAAIRAEVGRAFIGQDDVLDQVLVALLAGGHVLIEGVPGLGKTLLVRALARALALEHARVQFTPDLMPSDISGHAVYEQDSGAFRIRRGPVFTHLLLADEINRAPAKTQSALLEAMQEGQVTIEGESFALPPPFMALATQNPVEQEGTYPLPEAQLDRFLFKLLIGYPRHEDEVRMVA